MITIHEVFDGAIRTQGEVWGQYAACRVTGIPDACCVADLRVTIGGTPVMVEEVTPASMDGSRTVMLKLPEEVPGGYRALCLEYAGSAAEIPVRVLGHRGNSDE